MKSLFLRSGGSAIAGWLGGLTLLLFIAGCHKAPDAQSVHVSVFASGLAGPMGVETDRAGNVWVTEGGSAKNDGKVIVIKPNGVKYDAVINLSSIINEHSGELQGTAHLLLDKGTLYILSGNYLYTADVSNFKPGDAPLDGATLPYEDIAAFIRTYPFVNDADDSHPYNLTKGPDGHLYIADAGANAIIHRKSWGNYSILAEIPGIANPTPVGPPVIHAVPTSVWFDGRNFLVTTLTGFPFPSGQALIYKISLKGAVSIYQRGFTTLVDLAEGNYAGHIAVQHGTFELPGGFNPNTGSLVWVNGSTSNELTGGLNMPVGIKQHNDRTWYVTCLGDGSVLKISYH